MFGVWPEATTCVKVSFFDTSHFTGTVTSGMPPSALSGDGASRVHRTAPSGVGSPAVTPSENG